MSKTHGGGMFARTKGSNRKADRRYDVRALDYAKLLETSKAPDGAFHKPGSRKKIGG